MGRVLMGVGDSIVHATRTSSRKEGGDPFGFALPGWVSARAGLGSRRS